MNPVSRNRLFGLAIAVLVFGLDRLVKWFVLGPLQLREVGQVYLLPFFQFTWTENYGVSLGMLTATSTEMRLILIGATALIALVVLIWLMRERKFWDIFALGLILGGAAGNIRDRWHYGYVVDYADLHFGTVRPFLIFNIADAAITIGVVIILARSLFLREKRPDASYAAGTKPEPESTEKAAETN
jgi:signal peptidase II